MHWHLSERPDSFGFHYGEVSDHERSIRLNVLPPRHLWSGDTILPRYEPDERDWIIFADGIEIARVLSHEDVRAVGERLLLEPPETLLPVA